MRSLTRHIIRLAIYLLEVLAGYDSVSRFTRKQEVKDATASVQTGDSSNRVSTTDK